MKGKRWLLTVVVVICSTIQLCALPSQDKAVTLNLNGVSIENFLDAVKKQTGANMLYSADMFKGTHTVTVKANREQWESVLKRVLSEQGFDYVIKDGIVVIRNLQHSSESKDQKIKGTVVDQNGDAMPGVNIFVIGNSTNGVSTGIDGTFNITVPNGKNQLQVSFIGMKTQTVRISKGKSYYKIILEEDSKSLEDVVVTGYFQRKKISQTGAEVVVGGEEIAKVGSLNLLQAISAFDPTVRTIESTEFGSDPNHMPEITVRGEKGFDLRENADDSRTNPNAPLYIMDGIEVTATTVYDMDMNRIASFSILKDAAATSLYGSRGANGVILITTKRPEPGKIRMTVNANYNISIPDLRSYNLMDAREKLEYERLAGLYTNKYNNREEQTILDIKYNKILSEIERGVNTYWLSKPLTTSVNQRYSAFLEGGDEHFRYGLNLKYDNDKGVMKESGRLKYGISAYFSYEIAKKLVARNDISIDDVKATDSPYGSFSNYASMNPYERIYDAETGDMRREFTSNGRTIRNVFVNSLLPNKSYNKYTQVRDNFQVQWWATSHLMLKGNIAVTKQLNRSENYLSPESVSFQGITDAAQKGSYTISNGTDVDIEGNLTANYNTSLFDKLAVSVGVGSELISTRSESDGYTATGFLNDKLIYPSYAIQFKKGSTPSGSLDRAKSIGFFGNANLNWDNRYILDFTYRTDGSSRFGRESRFAPFWAVGAAWNVNREKFWTGSGYMKLRGSVGSTGSTNFSADQALTRFVYSNNSEYNGIYGAIVNAYGNPSLKWQNVMKYNIGLDMSILKNIITLNFDAYLERTENLLLNIDVAPSTGFTSYTENMGSMDNKGFEARLRFNILNNYKKDLNWNITLSTSHEKNKIRKISNAMKAMNQQALEIENNTGSSVYRMYEEGRSQTALMLVRSAGIDPATGNEIYIKRDGTLTFEYDPNDRVEVGDTSPKFKGYFNSNLTWKGFNLYMNFSYELGAKQYNSTLAQKVEGADPYYNADRRVLYDRWKQPGDVSMFRRIDDTSAVYQSTRLMQKNNYLNMSSLSLSYDIPRKYIQHSAIERCKFIFSMTDLFRLSTIKQERGTSYPFARTMSLGFNVTL